MTEAHKPSRRAVASDLVAGLTFAVINVPQAMANAVLAMVNPVTGLYALMIAMPVGALLTSSVVMNISTTGALSVAAGEALYHVDEGDRLAALAVLVLLAGLFQLVFGLLRMGRLIRFVSNSVMTGFIAGISALIVLGAIPDVTAYQSEFDRHLFRLLDTAINWRLIDLPTFVVGVATIALILAFNRTRLRRFSLVVALILATVLAVVLIRVFGLTSIELVGDVAEIPRSLPRPALPDLSFVAQMIVPALAVAVIGLVQSAGVGQTFPNPDGRFPDVSRDFVGQGAANAAASFFGAIPAGGSMSGTAVMVQAGAQTRLANIAGGVFVIAIVLALADLVMLMPMAALGGLLVVVGFQNLQPKAIQRVWSTNTLARVAMVVTFAATLALPLQQAILIGVALTFLLQVTAAAREFELTEIELVENGFPLEKPAPQRLSDGQTAILLPKGTLFFASAAALDEALPEIGAARGATVILFLRDRHNLGSTVIQVLTRYAEALNGAGGRLVLVEVSPVLGDQLARTGLTALVGEGNVHPAQPQIGASLNAALKGEAPAAFADRARPATAEEAAHTPS